jgi:hypothetical protein
VTIATKSPDYTLSTISVHEYRSTATVSDSATDDLNAREDARLRAANGIRDEVVFPRLRALGVSEAILHRRAMRLVRQVQYGLDPDGHIARLLGVTHAGINGTTATPEVV